MENEERYLGMLRYALDRKSVPSSAYLICTDDPKAYAEDRICLVKDIEARWRVFYCERGGVYDLAVHQSLYRACKEFFCRLTKCPSPWDFREEWERRLNE